MNKRGQHLIEYALIAILVVLGIVFMGPYVLRSVNAHYKIWDDSIQDTFEETLSQAPVNAIPNIPSNCSCTTTAGDCGSSLVGSQCGANQRIYNHTCNPQGCDYAPLSSCVNDSTCCTGMGKAGCGTVPIPAEWVDSGIPVGTPAPADGSCYYGQSISTQQCGSTTPTECLNDTSCAPTCTGTLASNLITYCNGADTSLDEDYPFTLVTDPTQCNGTKCQAYCQTQTGDPATQTILDQNSCMSNWSLYCTSSAGLTDTMTIHFTDGTSFTTTPKATGNFALYTGVQTVVTPDWGYGYSSKCSPDKVRTANFEIAPNEWVFRMNDCGNDQDFNDVECVFMSGPGVTGATIQSIPFNSVVSANPSCSNFISITDPECILRYGDGSIDNQDHCCKYKALDCCTSMGSSCTVPAQCS